MTIIKSLNSNQKILLSLGIVINLAIILFIPSHPDDFSTYHALACGFPAQHLNVYHASCNSYFHVIGSFRYQQDYEYVGVANSLILWVFMLAFNPLVSHYIWGSIALILTVIGLVKSFELQKNWLLILFYIPVTYPILHDDSPIRFSIIFFAWTPFLIKKALSNKGFMRYLFFALVSLGWLLSTEDKPFFVYLLPGLFFLHLAQDGKPDIGDLARFLKRGLLYLILFIPTLSFLIFSRMGGKSYLLFLADNNQTITHGYFRSISTAFLHLFSWFAFPVRAVDYNYAPGKIQPETAEALPWGYGIISVLSLATLLLVALMFLRFYLRIGKLARDDRQGPTKPNTVLVIISIALLFILPITGGAWSGHHYIFAHVAILILLLNHIEKFLKKNATAFLVVACCATTILTSLTPARSYNSQDSRRAVDYAYSIATSKSIINCSFSCYFEYSLRNLKNVPVTFATLPEEGFQLATFARSKDRDIIYICKNCTIPSTNELFGEKSRSTLIKSFGEWQLFLVQSD